MNLHEIKTKIGELQGALDWHHRGQFLLEPRYVLTVTLEDEGGEPLFWSNDEWWQPELDKAQIYPDQNGACLYYAPEIPSEYILFEEAEKRQLEFYLRNGMYQPEINERGNYVTRHFFPDWDGNHGTQYVYEHALKSVGNSQWRHYATKQDSAYFQYWYSLELMTLVSYAEGDIYVVRSFSIDSFMEELIEMQEYQFKLNWGLEEIDFISLREELEVLHGR